MRLALNPLPVVMIPPQVLITIYWLGRAANSCTSYNGPTLDLKEFEGLLSQMRKVRTGMRTGMDVRL